MSTTPERVAEILSDLGLDQPGLGALCGASKSVVNQWLSGKIKQVGAEYAFQIQKKKNYNAEWIILGTGEKFLTKALEHYNIARAPSVIQMQAREPEQNPTIASLLAQVKTMSPEGQFILLGRAEELALRYPAVKANLAK